MASQSVTSSHHENNNDWLCILCHKMSHHRRLGDLFGPYVIDFSSAEDAKYQPNSSGKEIWIHEDCLIWSDGVHLVGNKIRAMDEVIRDSLNRKCAACKTTGATIGCVGKRCRRKYHYICAVNSHCLLDESSFTLNCVDCLIKKERPQIEAV